MKIDPLSKEKYPESFLNDISEIGRNVDDNEREWLGDLSQLTNKPAFSVYLEAETQNVGSGVETRILWEADEIRKDTANSVDLVDSEYIVAVTGFYRVSLGFEVNAAVSHPNRTVTWILRVYYDNAVSRSWSFTISADNDWEGIHPSINIDLEEGKNIYATLEHNDVGNVDIAGILFSMDLHKLIGDF